MAGPKGRNGSKWSLFATLAAAMLLAPILGQTAHAEPTDSTQAETTEATESTEAVEMIEDAPPRIIVASQKAPLYPPAAQAARFTGTVKVKATVREDGSVGDVEVLECDHKNVGFEEAAIAAVKKWRFKPGTKDGAPTETSASFRLNFRSGGPGTGYQAFATGMSGVNSEAGGAKTTTQSTSQTSASSSSTSSEPDGKKKD